MNPSTRLRSISQALKLTHPGAAAALLDTAQAVARLERTLDEITAEALASQGATAPERDAMEQQDLDAEAAARVGFSSRHAEALEHLRRVATPLDSFTHLARPDWFDRPEYLNREPPA